MYFKLDSWAPHITYLESTGVRWDPGTYDFHNHPGNCNATVHQITLWETPQPKEGEMVDEWGFQKLPLQGKALEQKMLSSEEKSSSRG